MALAGGQEAAVLADLARLPPELQRCTEATAALALARCVDSGVTVATCVRELLATMAALRARAKAMQQADGNGPASSSAKDERSSPVADLTARISAARRRSAAS